MSQRLEPFLVRSAIGSNVRQASSEGSLVVDPDAIERDLELYGWMFKSWCDSKSIFV